MAGKKRRAQKGKASAAGAADSAGKSGLPIHDSLFKHLLTQEQTAGRFLRERLPQYVVQQLANAPPNLLPGSFVDEHLRPSQTDVLLQVPLKNGGDLLLYCLMDHKSKAERLAPLQMARYIIRILEPWYRDPTGPMPAVLPVIVHNGPRPWTLPTELRELAGNYPQDIQRHLLSLDHLVVDLCHIDDGALSQDQRLRAGLMALKYGTREKEELVTRLDSVLADLPQLEAIDRKIILVYITERVDSFAAVEASMQRIAGDRAQEFLHPVWQPLIERVRKECEAETEQARQARAEAEAAAAQAEAAAAQAEAAAAQAEAAAAQAEAAAKAEAQARAQAEAEAKAGREQAEHLRQSLAATLLGLAEHRFPPVSAAARARILEAGTQELSAWLARILTAPSVNALIGAAE